HKSAHKQQRRDQHLQSYHTHCSFAVKTYTPFPIGKHTPTHIPITAITHASFFYRQSMQTSPVITHTQTHTHTHTHTHLSTHIHDTHRHTHTHTHTHTRARTYTQPSVQRNVHTCAPTH